MKKIALITYEDQSKTYEAMSKLKNLADSRTLGVKQAVIIQKDNDGTSFSIKDGLDYQSANRVFTGGIIGMIVGVLAGPLGILCGWIIGDLAGAGTNYVKAKKNNTIFDSIAQKLDNNEVGLLIYMDEVDPELLNTLIVDKLDGNIERFDYDTVKEDVDTAHKHLEQ